MVFMNDLEFVRDRLERSVGQLRRIADETGIAYDTILRIKNSEGDPGYTKVRILADHFRGAKRRAAA